MRVYLSGPMSGLPEFNFPAFATAAARLRGAGYEVVSPAEIVAGPPPSPSAGESEQKRFYNACMRADLKAMLDCDAIALMRGWENSNGAHIELHVAQRVGLQVLFVDELVREREAECE